MRVLFVFMLVTLLAGCASTRNAPPQPGGGYWPINEQAQKHKEGADV